MKKLLLIMTCIIAAFSCYACNSSGEETSSPAKTSSGGEFELPEDEF